MRNYIVYNPDSGKILRTGVCSNNSFAMQAQEGEAVTEGIANDITQKIIIDGIDENDKPINPRVVDKTMEEIEPTKPKIVPRELTEDEIIIQVTKGQWQQVLDRLTALERK